MDYKQKYLKYKSKYLDLKNQQNSLIGGLGTGLKLIAANELLSSNNKDNNYSYSNKQKLNPRKQFKNLEMIRKDINFLTQIDLTKVSSMEDIQKKIENKDIDLTGDIELHNIFKLLLREKEFNFKNLPESFDKILEKYQKEDTEPMNDNNSKKILMLKNIIQVLINNDEYYKKREFQKLVNINFIEFDNLIEFITEYNKFFDSFFMKSDYKEKLENFKSYLDKDFKSYLDNEINNYIKFQKLNCVFSIKGFLKYILEKEDEDYLNSILDLYKIYLELDRDAMGENIFIDQSNQVVKSIEDLIRYNKENLFKIIYKFKIDKKEYAQIFPKTVIHEIIQNDRQNLIRMVSELHVDKTKIIRDIERTLFSLIDNKTSEIYYNLVNSYFDFNENHLQLILNTDNKYIIRGYIYKIGKKLLKESKNNYLGNNNKKLKDFLVNNKNIKIEPRGGPSYEYNAYEYCHKNNKKNAIEVLDEYKLTFYSNYIKNRF